MTPLRQRFIEDMQLRGLAPTTQRSYIHYVAGYAKFYNMSPEKLDLEAIRQYELHMLHEQKLSPESVNTFISSVQFLYTVTLEMPWGKECFPRLRVANRLPVVLSPEEVEEFFCHIPSLKYRALLRGGSAHLRSRCHQSERHRLQARIDPRGTGQRPQRPVCDALRPAAETAPALLAGGPARWLDVSLVAGA